MTQQQASQEEGERLEAIARSMHKNPYAWGSRAIQDLANGYLAERERAERLEEALRLARNYIPRWDDARTKVDEALTPSTPEADRPSPQKGGTE